MTEAAPTPRVLFVEDDPPLQRIFSRAMQKLGTAGAVVDSGASAEQALRESLFTVAFIDDHLAGESGSDVVERLKRSGLTLPVFVCVSGAFSEPAAAFGPFAGSDAKPATLEQMRALLARWC